MKEIKEINPSKKIKGILFYTTDDLVQILGLGMLTVRKYLKTGRIKGAVKVGRRYYISSRNLDHWLGKGRFFDKPDKCIVDFITETMKEQKEEIYKEINQKLNEKLGLKT